MFSADLKPVLAALDGLYEAVIADPAAWDDTAFASWAEDLHQSHPQVGDRPVGREVRRGLRQAQRLARFWSARPGLAPADWRSAVDEALGGPGWAPSLAIAELGLQRTPDPEMFAEVKRRYPVVRFRPWLEGMDYAAWLADGGGDSPEE